MFMVWAIDNESLVVGSVVKKTISWDNHNILQVEKINTGNKAGMVTVNDWMIYSVNLISLSSSVILK